MSLISGIAYLSALSILEVVYTAYSTAQEKMTCQNRSGLAKNNHASDAVIGILITVKPLL